MPYALMSAEPTDKLFETLLRQILAEMSNLSQRMTAVEQGQARLEQGQARLEGGQVNMEERLVMVEEKVDRRQMETRPIRERALVEIADTRAELRQLASQVANIEREMVTKEELRDVKTFLRDLRRDQRTLNDSMLGIKSEMRDMDERLATIEPNPTTIG